MAGPRDERRYMAVFRFARHYMEMVAAMLVGMVALGWLESLLAWATGRPHALDGRNGSTLLMAANMTVVVAAWMYLRGHRLRLIGKMVAGMNVGLLAMVPLWSGANSHHTPMMAGHGLMFLGMLVAMLHRRRHYSEHRQ